jgi:fimbrial chaperone protein
MKRNHHFALSLSTFLFGCLIFPPPVYADGILVMPTRIHLNNSARSSEITITNNNTSQQLIRVDARSWEQKNGRDVYAPTTDILVVPPVLSIAPGQEKVIRLGMRTVLSGMRERAFRIYVTQVASKIKGQAAIGLSVRLGVPVYVSASSESDASESTSSIVESAQLKGLTQVNLTVDNQGNKHIVINALQLYSDATKTKSLAEQSTPTAILSGTKRSFIITAHKALTLPTLVIEGTNANGPFSLTVPVMQAGYR